MTIRIQVNSRLKNKYKGDSKSFPNKNKHWFDFSGTLDEIKQLITAGKAIRYAVQDLTKENRNSNFTIAYGTFIDFDDIDLSVLTEILEDPLTSSAWLINHSYSSDIINGIISIHLNFAYDQPIENWEKQTEINRKLYSYYENKYGLAVAQSSDGKIDTGCFNANRLKYGNDKSDSIIRFDPNVRLSVSEVLSFQDTLGSPNTIRVSDSNYTLDASKIYSEIMARVITDLNFFIDFSDPNSIFFLEDHEFDRRLSNLPNCIQYDGYDPCREQSKSDRSKSFVVTYDTETFQWIWRSRARNIGGNLPEYYYRVKNNFWDTELSKEQWWDGLKLLYERFGKLDLFSKSFCKLPKPEYLFSAWMLSLGDNLVYSVDTKDVWLYEQTLGYWVKVEDLKTLSCLYTCWVIENYNISGLTTLPSKYLSHFNLAITSGYAKLQHGVFKVDTDHFPMVDCMYRIKDGQLLGYTNQIKNVHTTQIKYVQNPTYPIELEQYLNSVLDKPEESTQWLIKIIVLFIHRKLNATGKCLWLMGDTGSGKSNTAKMLSKSLGVEPSSISLEEVCDPQNRFAIGQLSDAIVYYFDDVTSTIRNDGKFKKMIPGSFDWNRTYVLMDSDVKNKRSSIKSKITGQTLITSEKNIWVSDAHQSGSNRRYYLFKFRKLDVDDSKYQDVIRINRDLFQDIDWISNLVNWALRQDAKKIFDELKEIDTQESWMKEIKHENRIEGDCVYRFCAEQLSVSQDPEVYTTSKELYDRWDLWSREELSDRQKRSLTKNRIGREINKNLKIIYGWDRVANESVKVIEGKSFKVYNGLKLADSIKNGEF